MKPGGYGAALNTLRNSIDYPLRQLFRWSRPGLETQNENKERLFAHLSEHRRRSAEGTAAYLLAKYHLKLLYENSSADNYRENLFYLELLEGALDATAAVFPPAIAAADIGASHWFYVQALYNLLRWWQTAAGRAVALCGYELDAYRVYVDFHSRADHARAHMRGLDNVRYRPAGFEKQPAQFDLITMLFPFVFLDDHLAWGLPRNSFAPRQLLAEAWSSLKPGGVLIVVNQGEDEHTAQCEMMQAAGIQPLAAYRHDSLLLQYDLARFVAVARRD